MSIQEGAIVQVFVEDDGLDEERTRPRGLRMSPLRAALLGFAGVVGLGLLPAGVVALNAYGNFLADRCWAYCSSGSRDLAVVEPVAFLAALRDAERAAPFTLFNERGEVVLLLLAQSACTRGLDGVPGAPCVTALEVLPEALEVEERSWRVGAGRAGSVLLDWTNDGRELSDAEDRLDRARALGTMAHQRVVVGRIDQARALYWDSARVALTSSGVAEADANDLVRASAEPLGALLCHWEDPEPSDRFTADEVGSIGALAWTACAAAELGALDFAALNLAPRVRGHLVDQPGEAISGPCSVPAPARSRVQNLINTSLRVKTEAPDRPIHCGVPDFFPPKPES